MRGWEEENNGGRRIYVLDSANQPGKREKGKQKSVFVNFLGGDDRFEYNGIE